MATIRLCITIILFVLITDAQAQFFDFFSLPQLNQNYQSLQPSAQRYDHTTRPATTKRPRVRTHKNNTVRRPLGPANYNLFEDNQPILPFNTQRNKNQNNKRPTKRPETTTKANLRPTKQNYGEQHLVPFSYDRPAITNRPSKVTVDPKQSEVEFKDDIGDSPTITTGIDEDSLTQEQRQRYIDLAESMCDRYKALSVNQIQAIPLLPEPNPVAVNVSTCTPVTAPLVIGGAVTSVYEYPHMALLGWRKLETSGYSWKCGGSLISDRYVLTAAHCSYQERDNTVSIGPPRVMQLGSSVLDDPRALVVKVASVVRHPKYKVPRSYYDLALVKSATKISFSKVIRPACLGVPPPVGKHVVATGWGRTETGADQSEELRSVSVSIWDMSECKELLGTSRKLPNGPSSDSQMCAGEKRGGKDTCQGDSGGPAQIQDGCIWRVVAVTSLGRSCGAANTPGLYATVQRAFVAAQVWSDQLHTVTAKTRTNQRKYNQRNSYDTDSVTEQQSHGQRNSNSDNSRQYTTQQQSYINNNPRNFNTDDPFSIQQQSNGNQRGNYNTEFPQTFSSNQRYHNTAVTTQQQSNNNAHNTNNNENYDNYNRQSSNRRTNIVDNNRDDYNSNDNKNYNFNRKQEGDGFNNFEYPQYNDNRRNQQSQSEDTYQQQSYNTQRQQKQSNNQHRYNQQSGGDDSFGGRIWWT